MQMGMSSSLAIGQSYLPIGPSTCNEVPGYLSDVQAAMRKRPAEASDITLAAAHHLVNRLAYEAGDRIVALQSLLTMSGATRDQLLQA